MKIKKKKQTKGILALVIAISMLGIPFPAYATSYGENLIVNGDGESGSFTGWTAGGDHSDKFTVVSYADWGTDSPDSSSYGFDYYPAQEGTGTGTLYQDIDISDFSQAVDQGAVAYDAHTFLRCYRSDSEAKIVIEQLDLNGSLITGGGQEIIDDSPDADSTWQEKTLSGITVLEGARTLRITQVAYISSVDVDNDFIEFDDIQLSLNQIGVTMDVSGNGHVISAGDSTPSATDDTDFGSVLASSGTITKTFTIQNSDTTGRSLTIDPTVDITGTNASDFSVSAPPAETTLSDGNSTTFDIQFDPSDIGERTATIAISNNTEVGSYTFTVQGTGNPDALVIDTLDPVGGTVGTAYAGHTFTATGGTGSKTYEVTSGALPGGLTLADDGTLSGTPTAYGNFTFEVTATDSASTPVTDSHSYSMTVNPTALVIGTTNPVDGTEGTAYAGYTFTSTGGTGSKTYAVTPGTLPAGLTLASDGALSGTPTAYGDFTFTVTATDGASTPVTDSHIYSMTINPATLVIDTTNPSAGTVGTAYAGYTFISTGGTGGKTYAVTLGALPDGLTLASNGTLSGTPTACGSFTFTVTATDGASTPVTDSHSYSMTINPATLVIDTTNPSAGTVGAAYGGHTFTSTGGTGSKTYAVTLGTLPAGLTLASDGALSGTPTAYGSFTFTVTATDGASTPVTDSHSYSMTINPATLVIDTSNPVDGTEGTAYAGNTFTATGGTVSKTYEVTSGTLPTGLTLASNGALSGTPTTYGSFTFTVTATDSLSATDSHEYNMTINPATLVIDTTNPSAGTIGASYAGHTFTSTGGTGSKTYAVTSGVLPDGLTLASNGTLSGTPTACGSFTFTVTATDGASTPVTDSHSYSITINPATLVIDTTNPSAGTVGTAYAGHTFTSTGGTGSKTYSVTSGTLPAGLTLASDGALSGTPTAYGSFTFTVTATDSASTPATDSHSYSMTVNPTALVIGTTNPVDGTEGTAYAGNTFMATGGTVSKTYMVTSGTLPTGLTLASNGALSGTPTTYGSFTFTVTATDSLSATDSHEYNMTINPATLLLNTTNPSAGTVGIAYAGHTFAATGGMGAKTYAVTSGTLPTGLTLASDGTLSGTPTASGNFTFEVTTTDSASTPGIDSHSYTILIEAISSNATLKASSTIKGQTVTSLGIPNVTLGSETAGAVTITSEKAADTSNAGSFITLFDMSDTNATVKVVKYASGATTANFGADAAYANQTISNGDFFIIKVIAQDTATINYYKVNVTVTPASSGGSGGSSGGSTPTSPTQPSQNTVVVVNGKEQSAGKETQKTEDGKSTVTVTVDNKAVESKIDEAVKTNTTGTGNLIQVPITDTKSEVAKVELTGDIVKKLEENVFDVSVKRDSVEYNIPAEEFTISKVAENLGVSEKSLADIKIEVKITKLDEKIVEKYNEVAKSNGAELVFTPVEFEIVAKTTKIDGTVREQSISKFSNYVERVMEIPAEVDPSKITTGVVFNSDGTYSHVPTEVYQKSGKWYAKLNSLTNSDYSVIWNQVTVKSVENHWAKDAVNDLASRLIIFNPEKFEPNKAITRADFAEYIVRALGLYREGSTRENKFTDVSSTGDRTLAILIASEYGIVSGYSDGTFRGDNQITREEAMVMYQRAMKITELTGNDTTRYQNYTDFSNVSGWAGTYVKEVLAAHVFNGTNATNISPKANLTYAEAAQAIKNLLVESELINK